MALTYENIYGDHTFAEKRNGSIPSRYELHLSEIMIKMFQVRIKKQCMSVP